jgi:hypothetical protein
LPTVLPRQRRAVAKSASPARRAISIAFNAFMVLSALLLTFVVLVREEEYALGEKTDTITAFEQAAAQTGADEAPVTIAPTQ